MIEGQLPERRGARKITPTVPHSTATPFHVTPAVAVAAAGGLAPGSAEVQLRDAFLSAYSGPAEKVSMGIPAMVGSEAA